MTRHVHLHLPARYLPNRLRTKDAYKGVSLKHSGLQALRNLLREAERNGEHEDTEALVAEIKRREQSQRLGDRKTRDALTFGAVKAELSAIGCEIKKTESGDEYRVNFKGGREAAAYYTNDLEDALATGKAMVKKGVR